MISFDGEMNTFNIRLNYLTALFGIDHAGYTDVQLMRVVEIEANAVVVIRNCDATLSLTTK